MTVGNSSNNIFSYETETKKAPPSIKLNVVPHESFTRICLMTSNDTGGKKSAMADDVTQGNVLHSNQRLRSASRISTSQRVQHASWTGTTWLLLLLWTNINVPPEWVVDVDVRIGNVCNLAT